MEPPQRPRPPVNHEKKSENWTPYPKQIDSMPGHLSCLFHRWCDLCCIMIIITRTFFDSEDRPSPSEMAVMGKNIERQLQGWYANLPNCLRVWETTVPHILTLQYVHFSTAVLIRSRSFLITDACSQPVLSHSMRPALRLSPIASQREPRLDKHGGEPELPVCHRAARCHSF